jgi:hypothetical protein
MRRGASPSPYSSPQPSERSGPSSNLSKASLYVDDVNWVYAKNTNTFYTEVPRNISNTYLTNHAAAERLYGKPAHAFYDDSQILRLDSVMNDYFYEKVRPVLGSGTSTVSFQMSPQISNPVSVTSYQISSRDGGEFPPRDDYLQGKLPSPSRITDFFQSSGLTQSPVRSNYVSSSNFSSSSSPSRGLYASPNFRPDNDTNSNTVYFKDNASTYTPPPREGERGGGVIPPPDYGILNTPPPLPSPGTFGGRSGDNIGAPTYVNYGPTYVYGNEVERAWMDHRTPYGRRPDSYFPPQKPIIINLEVTLCC